MSSRYGAQGQGHGSVQRFAPDAEVRYWSVPLPVMRCTLSALDKSLETVTELNWLSPYIGHLSAEQRLAKPCG